MEFHELIARLHELRATAQRERFSALAAQLQGWINHLTMRPQTYARRDDTADGSSSPSGSTEPPLPFSK